MKSYDETAYHRERAKSARKSMKDLNEQMTPPTPQAVLKHAGMLFEILETKIQHEIDDRSYRKKKIWRTVNELDFKIREQEQTIQRRQRALDNICPDRFQLWFDQGELMWRGAMRERLFKPVRQAFEVMSERGANLEYLLGKGPLWISDTPRSQLSNPNAQAECDQTQNHIRCGPGTDFETVLHEIGHAVQYHLSPLRALALVEMVLWEVPS